MWWAMEEEKSCIQVCSSLFLAMEGKDRGFSSAPQLCSPSKPHLEAWLWGNTCAEMITRVARGWWDQADSSSG